MTWLIVVAMAMTALTLALLLRPVLQRGRQPVASRAEFDLQVFRDQLAEVDRDQARGLLGPDEAEAARTEVKRRMLAAGQAASAAPGVPGAGTSGSGASGSGGRGRIGLALVIALVLPTAAAVLYLNLGAPHSRDRPLAERRAQELMAGGSGAGPRSAGTGERDATQSEVEGDVGSGEADPNDPRTLEEAAVRLADQLHAHPDDAGGWFLLGRAYLTLERYPAAIDALSRASTLAPDEPEVADAYAEALIAQAGGQIEQPARVLLQRVLELDPTSPQARFMLALDLAQRGDLPGAMQGWVDLIAMSPDDAPWLPVVREHLDRAAQLAGIPPASLHPSAEALALAAGQEAQEAASATAGGAAATAPGPGADDVAAAAAMSDAERSQMIRGMVERLAARLQQQPDDIEGWRRLARAYDVLGEPQKAGEARARIAALERR